MTNEEICIILNQYQYRNRTNWRDNKGTDWNCDIISLGDSPYRLINLDYEGAIAICEKLVKQSSDDDIKAIVLSITKPYKDRIAELENALKESEDHCFTSQEEGCKRVNQLLVGSKVLERQLAEANETIEQLGKELKESKETMKNFDREWYNRG